MSAADAWFITTIIVVVTCVLLIQISPRDSKSALVIVFFGLVAIVLCVAALSIPVQLIMTIWSNVK